MNKSGSLSSFSLILQLSGTTVTSLIRWFSHVSWASLNSISCTQAKLWRSSNEIADQDKKFYLKRCSM